MPEPVPREAEGSGFRDCGTAKDDLKMRWRNGKLLLCGSLIPSQPLRLSRFPLLSLLAVGVFLYAELEPVNAAVPRPQREEDPPPQGRINLRPAIASKRYKAT